MSDPAPLVLVVDDHRDNRELVVELLDWGGLRTCEARSGHEALQRALEDLPDLVLLDLEMPGLDGWEVSRRLRQDPRTRELRVLALTAHVQQSYLDRAREAGCDGVLIKPIDPEELVPQLVAYLAGGPAPGAREPM